MSRVATRPTWAEVSLTSLRQNFCAVAKHTGAGVTVCAVVKADAYGHGAVECARALEAEGAKWLGVTSLDEAIPLRDAGIEYEGYLANLSAPEVYARSRLALHVPRRQYANGLSGVPTIRVFEVLACGIPLVCAPWTDTEELFRSGQDYVVARDGAEMKALLSE